MIQEFTPLGKIVKRLILGLDKSNISWYNTIRKRKKEIKTMKKVISLILVAVLCVVLFSGCGYNKQIIDFNYKYNYAIISLMNGELVEGPISSWNDYDNSDMVQVTFTDGNIYYTHGSNVLMIYDPNL
jgi:hypothetical protein